MANMVYDYAKKFLVASSSTPAKHIDLLGNTIKVALVGSTYIQASSHFLFKRGTGAAASITPSCCELNGTGYAEGIGASTGRKTLASKVLTQESANTRVIFDAADITWTAINAGTAGKLIVIREGGRGTTTSDTGTVLICTIDSGFPVVTNGKLWKQTAV
jgi:hypothetical protein